MRISDWSSDVCSSDLFLAVAVEKQDTARFEGLAKAIEHLAAECRPDELDEDGDHRVECLLRPVPGSQIDFPILNFDTPPFSQAARFVQSYFRYIRGDHALSVLRSDERRVGKECVSTCRYRV